MSRTIRYKYNITMTYLNNEENTTTEISSEHIKQLLIDNDYDNNCMPTIYATLVLDKSFIDHMIKNINKNLIIITISQYDDLDKNSNKIICLREKFTYFLENDVNKNDDIDYNEKTKDEHSGATFKTIIVGLMCINHINFNKKSFEINMQEVNMMNIIKYITSHFSSIIIEKLVDNTKFKNIMLPTEDSVNKMLNALNNYRVFYDTPYRYYQDFDTAYIISSSGKGIKKKEEDYVGVLVNIEEAIKDTANDVGYILNTKDSTYEVRVNYINTQIYDNSIINKSKSSIQVIDAQGNKHKSKLKNNSDYSKEHTISYRVTNKNNIDGVLKNLEAESNNNNFFIYFNKNDLDMNLFTINKKITVNNIDKYKEFNGKYLLYRKRDCFLREDDEFVLTEMVYLKKIGN